jgi:hypothetical protein
MNRFVVLALSASMLLGACSDHKATTTAAAPELLPAQPAPPAVVAPPVALPPLPSVTAGDAAAAPAAERPTGTAIDSPATNPKGTLTKDEETKAMPMAGHGNNHSSPSLESSPQK